MDKIFLNKGTLFLVIWMLAASYPEKALAQINNAVLQYATNRAAVVMVRTEILAEVNVQKIKVNEKFFNRLLDSIHRLELDSIFLNPEEKLDIVLNEFERRPSYYFINEFNYFRHREKVTAHGSGFIISGNGFVLTNCHVVDEDDNFINRRFILSAFNSVSETNISSLELDWGVKFTEIQRNLLNRTFANVYSRIVPIELEEVKKKVIVILNIDDTSGKIYAKEVPAVIIKKGRSMPGKDLAILKIELPVELPSIPLAASNEVLVGEDIFAYGYPNPVNNNEYLSEETVLEPTLTKGIISALKKTVNGWPVVQMDAGINHGNSGGPVCNKNGEAIGISTFGSLDDNARGLAPGLNFAIPLEVIRDFFSGTVVPVPGSVSVDFSKAMKFFQARSYNTSLNYLKKVEKKNSSFPNLHKYMQACKINIMKGNDRSAHSMVYLIIVAIIASFIGLLIWYKLKQ